MPCMTTKDKIKSKAVEIFNESGYGSVSLFELANELGISRGNITYHYKDKETLLTAIVDEMWERINLVKQKTRQFPSFQNLREEIRVYIKFQKEYSFIFHDNQVMKHTHVSKIFKKMADRSVEDFEAAITFSIQVGNMKKEPLPGAYHNLAISTWMLSFFWTAQQTIRKDKNEDNCEKVIWINIIPYFTEKGLASFKKYFGVKYFNSLGKPFNKQINQFVTF